MSDQAKPVWKTFVDSIESKPWEWTVKKYALTHKPSGLRFWIGGGYWFFKCTNAELNLGFFGSYMVWRAYKRWTRRAYADLLGMKEIEKPAPSKAITTEVIR